MKKMSKNKKTLLILSTCLVVLTTSKTKASEINITYNDNYGLNNDIFATYNGRDIYIGDKDYILEIMDIESDNIYVIDDRNSKDPNIKIMNSYSIRNIDISNILDILIEYENIYPSDWNRTKKSMFNEWIIHNICYDLNIKTESTESVDLDNIDENKYNHIIIKHKN